MDHRTEDEARWHTIQADFDRLAHLPDDGWDHNRQYHRFLLEHLPARCEAALDIGCGTGVFTRLLAERADRVVGLDLSPEMIRLAQERSRAYPNIDFQVANALRWQCESDRFDCVASIATLHHLPMAEMLARMKRVLNVNGILLVLDLYKSEGMADILTGAPALPLSAILRIAHTGRLRPSPEARNLWAEHGRHDRYLTIPEVRSICAEALPGAGVRKHFFWRYSIVWRKPG